MTARRLHAVCPRCQRPEPLRPDGSLVRHSRWPSYSTRKITCEGSGTQPSAESVAAWLTQHEAEGAAVAQGREQAVVRAREALATAEAALTAATAEREERAAWCARARGRVQSGDARVSDGCVTSGGCDVG